MNYFILLTMVFLHIIDDFVLQPVWLANGKQKSWWRSQVTDKKYDWDYICCLFIHAMSWTFMMMLPVAWYYHFELTQEVIHGYWINTLVHAVIDDLKANRHKLSLLEDQSLHIIQIVTTYTLLVVRV